MNIDVFSQWLKRQGHHVYHSSSSYWYDAGPRALQAFPYHWLIEPSEQELRQLMFSSGSLSARYSAPIESREGKASYHIVLRRPYTLDMLKSQARNGVKKGQCHFLVETISFSRLAEEGWQLQQDTLERQGRLQSMDEKTWKRLCMAADGLPGFEVWAATCGGELAGALLTARIDNTVFVPYALSRSSYLHDHVNNVLFFNTATNILARDEISEIFFTMQSLDAPESVDEFKLRMSLIPKPVRQRVVLNPLVTPLSTGLGYSSLSWLMKRYPGSNFLAKTEGMVRFNRLGKIPLTKQVWPECLSQYRERIEETSQIMREEKRPIIKPTSTMREYRSDLAGCQIPGYQRIMEGEADLEPQPLVKRFKRAFAKPWNYMVKPRLKQVIRTGFTLKKNFSGTKVSITGETPVKQSNPLKAGDIVRVRDRKQIEATLDPFKELKGCAFLEYMWPYCGTNQRVLQPVERFLDERDYKVKKARGVVLLEGLLCHGTPVFGRCDRACHLFWREEWLEKLETTIE